MVVIRYLLSIVEVCSILLILILSRLQLVLQSAEVPLDDRPRHPALGLLGHAGQVRGLDHQKILL